MRLGPLEIGLILVIILIVFGVGKIPQVGEGLGKAIRSFRKASRGDDEEAEPKVAALSTKDPEKAEKPEKKA
jgi:sec-independent protein translocase protein TatA